MKKNELSKEDFIKQLSYLSPVEINDLINSKGKSPKKMQAVIKNKSYN